MSSRIVGLLKKIGEPFALQQFLGEAAATVRETTGARRAFFALRSEGEFYTAASDGPLPRDLLEEDERRAFAPLLLHACDKAKPVDIADALRQSGQKTLLPLAGMGIRAAKIVPLGRYGAFACYRTEPGPLQDAPLEDLAYTATLAVEVTRLREERRTDEITGGLSHGAFLSRLTDEVSRASMHGRPVSVAFVDPDHGAARPTEMALRKMTEAILKKIRPTDRLARFVPDPSDPDDRYGGDEFHILLPETNRGEAAVIAHHVREELAGAGHPASIGVASIPEDADSSETLLIAVDEAVGRAKRKGNQVSLTTGPVEPTASVPGAIGMLASREGRALEEMLRHVFASESELTGQLRLTAALLGAAVEADRALVAALDETGGFLAMGRSRFPESEDDAIRETLRETVRSGSTTRPSDGRAAICIPVPASGRVIAVAYVDREEGDVSIFQETMLSALAGRIGSELSGSIRFQKRREEIEARREAIRRTVAELRQKYDFSAIVGEGPKLLEVLQLVARAAETDAPVLVLGHSGTGKELIARAVHANSRRKNGPFVVMNCAAVPMTLLESELFGHVRGAFTGASTDRAGLFESANGGTIFLDEIAEMPLETQAKLLRALQFGEVQHLGSDSLAHVDTRVVAATNRDLAREVQEKKFREDLYFRINVFPVEVPPLRDHLEDVPAITHHYLKQISGEMGRPLDIEPAALEALGKYHYPGNVRELENILMRASAMAAGNTITVRDLPDIVLGGSEHPFQFAVPRDAGELNRLKKQATREVTDQLEVSFVKSILTRTQGNVSEAARITGFNRTSLQKLLSRHHIEPSEFRKKRPS